MVTRPARCLASDARSIVDSFTVGLFVVGKGAKTLVWMM